MEGEACRIVREGVCPSRLGGRAIAGGIPGLSIQSRIFSSSLQPGLVQPGQDRCCLLAWTRLLVPGGGLRPCCTDNVPSNRYSVQTAWAGPSVLGLVMSGPRLTAVSRRRVEPVLPSACLASHGPKTESNMYPATQRLWPNVSLSEGFPSQLNHGGDDNAVVSWLGTRLHRKASRLRSA